MQRFFVEAKISEDGDTYVHTEFLLDSGRLFWGGVSDAAHPDIAVFATEDEAEAAAAGAPRFETRSQCVVHVDPFEIACEVCQPGSVCCTGAWPVRCVLHGGDNPRVQPTNGSFDGFVLAGA